MKFDCEQSRKIADAVIELCEAVPGDSDSEILACAFRLRGACNEIERLRQQAAHSKSEQRRLAVQRGEK